MQQVFFKMTIDQHIKYSLISQHDVFTYPGMLFLFVASVGHGPCPAIYR